jgi:hypothetical protein
MDAPSLRLVAAEGPVGTFSLRPGSNTFGRSGANLHVIPHPSVSNCHCEVVWDGDSVVVRDLGSTNGTFINGQRVQQAVLGPGQILRLGSVEGVFEVPDSVPAVAEPAPAPPLAPPLARPMPTASAASATTPRAPPLAPTAIECRSFARMLPGAISFPLSKNGLLLLIGGTVLYTALDFVARFSAILSIVATGYLFAYMQKVLAASAYGERELPDWPDLTEWWGDILQPFLLLAWTCLCCFGPAWLLLTIGGRTEPAVRAGFLGLMISGGFYFPMALLATATTDNFLALNPAVVVPSMARVLVSYLAACGVLLLLVGAQLAANYGAELLALPIWSTVLRVFVWLYLLCVGMRVLGLLFYAERERLGWF